MGKQAGAGTGAPRAKNANTVTASVGIASIGGALIAIQILVNGVLTTAGSGPVLAAWLSYLGTLASAIIVILVLGRALSVFTIIKTKGRPWWPLVGVAGVPTIVSTAWGAPILGVGIAAACSIGGQVIAGLLLDSRGIGVAQRLPLSARRMVAGLIAIGGLILALGANAGELDNPVAAVLLAIAIFVSGMFLALQNAGNGAVVGVSKDPLVPVLCAVTGGTITMTILVGTLTAFGASGGAVFPTGAKWWMYLGGPVGMGIVLASTLAIRALGTFGLTLVMVVGQMVTGTIIDLLVDGQMNWGTLWASIALIAAVLLARQPSPKVVADANTDADQGFDN